MNDDQLHTDHPATPPTHEASDVSSPRTIPWGAIVGLPLLAVVLAVGLSYVRDWMADEPRSLPAGGPAEQASAPGPPEDLAYMAEMERMPMERDEPGVINPTVYAKDEVDLPEDTMVLGVVAGGKPRAYLAGGMDDFDVHIVHDDLNGVPVTVTFCDKTECTRAFLREGDPSRIRMGGWSGEEMWLLIDGKRYLQSSKAVPLEEYEIVKTTWREWKQQYPDTDIYLGKGLIQ